MKILKAVGSVAKGIGKALVHDLLPIPNIKETVKNLDGKRMAEELRKGKELPSGGLMQLADLLDDGKINQSVDEAKIEAVTRAITGASGFIAVIYYLITVIF